jgi:hypothetical protein
VGKKNGIYYKALNISTKNVTAVAIISSENTKWFTLVFNNKLYEPEVLTSRLNLNSPQIT